jgi:hypothetical protein
LGQPGIQKVPFRHARHLSWGCVSQHNLSHPSTLCSEVCCPGVWGVCVRSLFGGSPPVCVACFSGVEHCPWSPPFRQSPLQFLVMLGSLLSVLCVPSILVLHRTLPSLQSWVSLRRSRLCNPCNTLLLLPLLQREPRIHEGSSQRLIITCCPSTRAGVPTAIRDGLRGRPLVEVACA